MNISDFLVILSIIVTIISFFVSNNRRLCLYKFNRCSVIIVVIYVILVNYLIFFDEIFYDRGLYLKCFICSNGLKANIYAYIITLISLFLLIYYIGWSNHFPKQNNKKIVDYYQSLISTNTSLLMQHIDTYHRKGIEKRIDKINNEEIEKVKEDKVQSIINEGLKARAVKDKDNDKCQTPLDTRILTEIVFNNNFIKKSMEIDPLYFLTLVCNLKTERIINSDTAIETYFTFLLESKNIDFISELEDISDHEDKKCEEIINDGLKKYLPLIFKDDLEFIKAFELGKIIGQSAIKEIKTNPLILNLKRNEYSENLYRSSICYQCFQFFETMFRYIIDAQKEIYDKRIYLGYINFVIREIISCCEQNGTYAGRFIEDSKRTIDILIQRCGEGEENQCKSILEEIRKEYK